MKYQQGFSLVELMVAIGVAGVVMMSGVPSFIETVKQNRLISQVNGVMGAIATARTEGAKRSQVTMTLCPSSDGSTCVDTNAWEIGWIVMVDADGDRVLDAADGDEVVKFVQPLSGDNTLRTDGFDSDRFLQISSEGEPTSQGTFVICDDRGAADAKAIVISVVGQTRFAVDEDGDEIVNSHDSAVNVTCPA